MIDNINKIAGNKLFNNINESDISCMLECLGCFEKSFGKNELILRAGDEIKFVGIVICGSVKIIKTDYDDNEVIIANVADGDIFGEVFACANNSRSPVNIISSTDSKIIFFDYQKIITSCTNSSMFHQQLIANMLGIIANKCLYLNSRIDIVSRKTLRDKILAYLYNESKGRKYFSVHLNREDMANFLCADRSALSNELSKMKRDGLLDYYKNKFSLNCLDN